MSLNLSFQIPCLDRNGKAIGKISRDVRGAEFVPSLGTTITVLKDLELKVVEVRVSGQFPSLDLIWVVLEPIELTGDIKNRLNDMVKKPFNWTFQADTNV